MKRNEKKKTCLAEQFIPSSLLIYFFWGDQDSLKCWFDKTRNPNPKKKFKNLMVIQMVPINLKK